MYKKIGSLLLGTLVALGLLAGCSSAPKEAVKTTETPKTQAEVKTEELAFKDSSYMVAANWLKDHGTEAGLVILDARGEKDYGKEHVKGALGVTWQQFSKMDGKPGDAKWGTLLEATDLGKKIDALGITKDSKVLVYGGAKNAWGEEGRIVWMLRAAGVKNAFFVNEGYDAIKNTGVEVSSEASAPGKATGFTVAEIDLSTSIFTEELKKELNSGIKIIDTREKDEFEGAQKYGEARGGHIPGAINIPYAELFDEKGALKSATALQSLLDEKGIKSSDRVVLYCTVGIRSGYMTNVLKMLGYEKAQNYQDSFYGWAGDQEAPVEK